MSNCLQSKYPSEVRKVQFFKETICRDAKSELESPALRAAVAIVIKNKGNLNDIATLAEQLAKLVMPDLVAYLGEPALAYGKAAIVGMGGRKEDTAALLHPQLGLPIRQAIGGGKAIIPSSSKVGTIGTMIDVPLAHKDDSWSFAHLDTMTLSVYDAPRDDEMVLFVVIAAGERAFAVIGKD